MAEILLGLNQLTTSTVVTGNMRLIQPLQASISGSAENTANTPLLRKYAKADVKALDAAMTGSMRRFKTIRRSVIFVRTWATIYRLTIRTFEKQWRLFKRKRTK
jgi:hypothetical protein